MILAYLLLLTGLTISAVAIYYSVVGLTAIFSAAVIPIIVMGSALEVAKLVCASWLKANWERVPRFMKLYMSAAVVVLMLITSMGIFGFLSKAHNDQNLVSGDVLSKIAVYDEKIKTEKENIEANRKALKQMDEGVDQVLGRSTDEKGADKAVAIRRSQQKERARIQAEIQKSQQLVAELNDARAPIAAEVRKVEAEVGPIKYIAKFIYGEDGANENMLEKAVTWIIILIVVVFDPLAVIMLLGAQMTFAWHRKGHDPLAEETEEDLLHDTVPVHVTEVTEEPVVEEQVVEEATVTFKQPDPIPEYKIIDEESEADWPEPATVVYPEHIDNEIAHVDTTQAAIDDSVAVEKPESELDKWNRMIAEAEAEVAKESSIEERVAKGDSYIDTDGNEVSLTERPGDYVTPPEDEESKKKTYMTKDEQGQIQVKNRT